MRIVWQENISLLYGKISVLGQTMSVVVLRHSPAVSGITINNDTMYTGLEIEVG